MITDIHTHLIHGIDDGPKTLEDAIELGKYHASQGVGQIIATPHFNIEKDDLNEFIALRDKNFKELKCAFKKENIQIELKAGAELYFSPMLASIDLEPFAFAGTEYVLIEFSTRTYPPRLKQTLQHIINEGYTPIIAHIERYPYFVKDSQVLVELVEMGALLQVNAETFLDKSKKRYVNALVRHNLVHLVASDAHDVSKRKQNLLEYLGFVETHELARNKLYLMENADKIFMGREISVFKAKPYRKIGSLFL